MCTLYCFTTLYLMLSWSVTSFGSVPMAVRFIRDWSLRVPFPTLCSRVLYAISFGWGFFCPEIMCEVDFDGSKNKAKWFPHFNPPVCEYFVTAFLALGQTLHITLCRRYLFTTVLSTYTSILHDIKIRMAMMTLL